MPALADDLVAFTEALGPENAPIVVPLAFAHWPSAEARDEFIGALIGVGSRG